jgi:hypothetical protein
MSGTYLPAPRPPHAELIKLGAAAVDAGCEDPLVWYCYGAALHDVGRAPEAHTFLETAVQLLDKSQYPSHRICAAAARLRRLDGRKETRATCDAVLARHRARMAVGLTTDIERRVMLDSLWGELQAVPREQQVAFVKELGQTGGADPWLTDTLEGLVEVQLAWDARGRGWAREVKRDGWAGFRKHLGLARDALIRAWERSPQLPEAPAEMIDVAMGAGDELGERTITWFERATAAQVDYQFAYDKMSWSVTPRWGGSHAAMFEIGLRGMKTDRYDTDAPWQLVRIIEKIGRDDAVGWDVLKTPGVYEAMTHVVGQYAEYNRKHGKDDAWPLSYRAALAWRAGKYAEARRVLERLGDGRLQPQAFALFESKDAAANVAHAYAMSSPLAPRVREADAALGAGRTAEALAALRALAADADLPPRAAPYLKGRVAAAERLVALDQGEWVDIQPKTNADLAGWLPLQGLWTIDPDGQLRANSTGDRYWPTLLCRESYGDRVQFRAVMEPQGATGARPGALIGSGSRLKLYVNIGAGNLVLADDTGRLNEKVNAPALANINGPTEFVVTYADGLVSLTVGGHRVLDAYKVPDGRIADVRVGVHVSAGGVARFSGLRVRKIPPGEAPAAPDAPAPRP